MSTHNICFRGEIRKKDQHFSDDKSTLSVAMVPILTLLSTSFGKLAFFPWHFYTVEVASF